MSTHRASTKMIPLASSGRVEHDPHTFFTRRLTAKTIPPASFDPCLTNCRLGGIDAQRKHKQAGPRIDHGCPKKHHARTNNVVERACHIPAKTTHVAKMRKACKQVTNANDFRNCRTKAVGGYDANMGSHHTSPVMRRVVHRG